MMGAAREAAGKAGPAPKSFSSPKACIYHLSRRWLGAAGT